MREKLLNIKEVAKYLDLSQEKIEELVRKGEIPAYKIGGTHLRFKFDQIEVIKNRFSNLGTDKHIKTESRHFGHNFYPTIDKMRDFLHFNDFYIISAIIIVIILIIVFKF